VAEDDREWETLLLARKRTQVSLADLVAAIREGVLVVGQRAGAPGFHGLVLRVTDVDALSSSRRARAPFDIDSAGMTSAARFGRSVGLRDEGNFIALIEAGHVPAVRIVNPATGRLQHFLRPEHVAAFHRRFATLTTLAAETGLHRNALRGQLAASGSPVSRPTERLSGPSICERRSSRRSSEGGSPSCGPQAENFDQVRRHRMVRPKFVARSVACGKIAH
jgi:hypothetical protein